MSQWKVTGILPALVTPFREDNKSIHRESTAKLLELLLQQGANGFYILGGTGEGLVMARPEREELCQLVVEQVAHRKPVINHIAAMNFREAVDLARHAEKAGCDAIAAVPPSFFYYSEDDLYDYYKGLAQAVSIPLIIYYHPSAQKDMSAKLIARIFEIDNVTGVKWSSNNFFELMKLKELTHGEMNIINGPDELLVSGLAAGADAGIGSTYNIMLPQFVEIYDLMQQGKCSEARALQLRVNRVIDLLLRWELIPAVKQGVRLMGIEAGDATFPMKHYTPPEAAAFEQALRAAGWPLT